MDAMDAREKINEIICEVIDIDPSIINITPSAELSELGADSLDTIEILMMMGENLDIPYFGDEEFEALEKQGITVQNLYDLAGRKGG